MFSCLRRTNTTKPHMKAISMLFCKNVDSHGPKSLCRSGVRGFPFSERVTESGTTSQIMRCMQDRTPGFKRTSSINFCIFSVCCIDADIFYVILLNNQKIGVDTQIFLQVTTKPYLSRTIHLPSSVCCMCVERMCITNLCMRCAGSMPVCC